MFQDFASVSIEGATIYSIRTLPVDRGPQNRIGKQKVNFIQILMKKIWKIMSLSSDATLHSVLPLSINSPPLYDALRRAIYPTIDLFFRDKTSSPQLLLQIYERPEVTRGKICTVRWVGKQFRSRQTLMADICAHTSRQWSSLSSLATLTIQVNLKNIAYIIILMCTGFLVNLDISSSCRPKPLLQMFVYLNNTFHSLR